MQQSLETTTQQALPQRRSLLARHPLISYFVLAYAIAWLIWLPLILSKGGGAGLISFTTPAALVGTTIILIVLGSFGPALSAIIMSAAIGGWPEVRRLLGRIVQVRVRWQWYVVSFLLPLLISVFYRLPFAYTLLASRMASGKGALAFGIYLVSVVLGLVLGSPLGEEPGWRGFALPRLQQRFGPLPGSLILGVFWALWHMPIMFTVWGRQYQVGGLLAVLLFIVTVIGYSVIMTWLFNNTRGSIFMAILFHSAIDTSPAYFLLLFPEQAGTTLTKSQSGLVLLVLLASAIAWLLVAAVIALATRGTLSYKPVPVSGSVSTEGAVTEPTPHATSPS